jgi:hypothetical protein
MAWITLVKGTESVLHLASLTMSILGPGSFDKTFLNIYFPLPLRILEIFKLNAILKIFGCP